METRNYLVPHHHCGLSTVVLHEQAGEHAEGAALADACIEHTPTGVDFYELKARLLESGGDVRGAADVVDAGRDLDRQDRYINNQATQTLLRAGRWEEASKLMSLFTRHEGNPEQNLYDMQCSWYELELADCWRRKGDLGRSLRKYSECTVSTLCRGCKKVDSPLSICHAPLSVSPSLCMSLVL